MAEGKLVRATVSLVLAYGAVFSACAPTRGGSGALEPRFVAVHNALAAVGLAQLGPIHQGVLAEGREARITVDLPAGCTTIAAVGGDGVRDIDAALLDAQGHSVAHDTTAEAQAVLRTCVDAGAYVLVIKLASGSGDWVAATWQGGAGGETSANAAAASPSKPQEANGTCAAPIPLAAGTVNGSTTHGDHENAGSCGSSDSRELVYVLEVTQRQRVTIDVEAKFDSVLYIRKDDCTDPNAEVDCSDDATPDRTHSRIERVLEPGRYFVFVDGYAHESGAFNISVSMIDVLALSDECRRASLLAVGSSVSGTTAAMGNDAEASCGGGAEGADAPWRMELAARSRLRIVEHSEDVTPVVHVRRSCADEQSEVACGEPTGSAGDAVVTGVFEAGAYAVFADAQEQDVTGRYSLQVDAAPTGGSGVSGDGCGDAIILGGNATVSGDTFAARDDVAGSCGGAGGADVLYRLDLAKRSRLSVSLQEEEARHMLVAWRRCGDRSTEVACGRDIDEVLGAGTYFLAVDGSSADVLGRFTLSWSARDLSAQSGACLAAPKLIDGRMVTASTIGAGDKFGVSCVGHDSVTSGADRVYKFTVSRRERVHIALTAASFEAALAVRKICADVSGGARAAEIACEADSDAGQHTVIDRTLEPGTYWVIVDGLSANEQGPFTLEYRTTH